MREILTEAFMDSYPILPILFITYLLFEYFERHHHLDRVKSLLSKKGLGPFIGAVLGILPQCGFSIAAAGLYLSNTISIGTLVSVFIATSDEAIPILISYPSQFPALLCIIFSKLIIAFIAGYLLDICYHPNRDTDKIAVDCTDDHDHILIAALRRTLKIFIFIFITNVLIGGLITLIGEDHLSTVLLEDTFWQPFFAGIFGFLPNCAASVILTQLFIGGSLSFGSYTAGLITNAGLGMLVLAKSRKHYKDLAVIAIYVLAVAVLCGVVLQWIL